MPGVFDEAREDLAAERARLKELTTADEYRSLRRTTRNAHYTHARYAELIWDALARLGFTEGNVLEPGCGSGNFIGLAPDGAAMTGVERDPVTAAITAHLYPDASIRAESFADTRIPAMYFDAAVGNVPFGKTQLSDPAHNPGRRLSMHNLFIAKSLELTRHGGMVALVTSRYTMDARNPEARRRIAALGDLVAAIRLPDGAHRRAAGTDVVTDLLILRRRHPADPGKPDGWEFAPETALPGGTAQVNEYFIAHPEFVLGEMKVGRGMHGENDVLVAGPADASAALSAALETAVTRARATGLTFTERPESADPVPLPPLAPAANQIEGLIQAHPDGTFTRLVSGAPYPYEPPAAQADELRHLIGMRDTVLALLRAEAASPDDTPEINGLRATLNTDYTAYVGRHGPVKRFTWAATGKTDPATGQKTRSKRRPPQGKFRDDPLYPLVDALEESYDPVTKTAVRADIFTQRVVVPETPMLGADTADEALAICLNTHGEARLDEIARLLGTSEDSARAELGTLVFDEPGTGRLIWAPMYLSGDVRVKLAAAVSAAEEDPRFAANVTALREVVPRDRGPAEIEAQLGAGWIAPNYVQQFLREALGDSSVTVERSRGRKWKVSGGNRKSTAAISTWGTRGICAQDIAQRLLTGTAEQITVKKELGDGVRVTDHDATEEARQKAREMADRFSIWVWEDPERTRDLCRVYNDRHHAVVPVSFDGVRLFTPGLSPALTLRAHQFPAIARVIYQGSAGLVHDTGAGKTYEAIVGVRERQRLRLSHKPCFVVQKNKVEDFRKAFLRAYPDARLLVADTRNLTGSKRREFIARCATGNPTAIIMSREAFKSIPVSAERLTAYLKEEEISLEIAIEDAKKSGEDDRTVKQIEAELENTRERRKEQAAKIGQDRGLTYEDTGIDYLVLDEARAYRKGPVISSLPGMADAGSARALDLLLKLGYHHERFGETRVCLADATPWSNKISEIYTWQRYLHYDIEPFDDWVRTNAKMAVTYEMLPGGDFKAKARLREIINAVDLHMHLRERNDFKLNESLDLKLPVMAGGKPQIAKVDASDEFLAYSDLIRRRYQSIPKGPPQKGADNHLKVLGDFLKASLDLRLVGRSTHQPQKVDVTADIVYDKWVKHRDDAYKRRDGTDHPDKGSLILVFASLGTPGRTRKRNEDEEPGPYDNWNFYDQLRANLIDRGMPGHLIKFMHEADGNPDRLAQIFHDARNGKIHVLVGSTEKLGIGVNVQDRAVGLIQVTPPWNWDEPHQEIGRVHRQHNQNKEFFCIRVVTSPSADAIKWERARQKEMSFRALMTGEIDGNTIRIPDDDLSSAEVMAAASGNPRMLERAELEGNLSRLTRLRRAWQQSQTAMEHSIREGGYRTANWQRVIGMIDTALPLRKDTRGDAFAMTINGEHYTKRAEAADRLRQVLLQRIAAADRYQVTRGIVLGEIGGFTLTATLAPRYDNSITLTLEGIPDHPTPLNLDHRELPDKTGIITRLENRIAGLEQVRSDAEAAIGSLDREMAEARASLGGSFPQQDEYDQTAERLKALEADLASTSKPAAVRRANDSVKTAAPDTRAEEVTASDLVPRQATANGPEQAAGPEAAQPADPHGSTAETESPRAIAASDENAGQPEDQEAIPDSAPEPAISAAGPIIDNPETVPASDPLPAGEPYAQMLEAKADHSRVVDDYLALTRAPFGSRAIVTYGQGVRDAYRVFDAAYHAVGERWEKSFAGDPQKVAERFTSLASAANFLALSIAQEQYKAPKFREALDGFTRSATRLASRTQATAQDPEAWTHVFGELQASTSPADLGPEAITNSPEQPLPAVSQQENREEERHPTETAEAAITADAPGQADHPEKRENPAADEPSADPNRDREVAADLARQAAEALDNGEHQRALDLIDKAELAYPNRGVSYDVARDQVRAAMRRAAAASQKVGQPSQSQTLTAGENAGPSEAVPVASAPAPAAPQEDEQKAMAGNADLVASPDQQQGQAVAAVGVAAATSGPAARTEEPAPLDHATNTLEKYTRPDGTLDPERQALHDEIMEHFLAGHQPQTQPIATFFGGGSASGKSALEADTPDNVRIDADAIKEMLPEYQEMLRAGDEQAAAYAHQESSELTKRIEKEAQRRRYNYILDGTGDTSFEKMAAKVGGARAAGYGAVARYVTVDTETAVQRARKRAERTGRMVPETVLRVIHASVTDTFAQAADERLFDKLELLDNNEADHRRIIARDDGTGLRVLDPAAYDRFLAKGEEGAYARQHRSAGGTPLASETGELGLPAARSTGHSAGPGTVGRDRPGTGRHEGQGPVSTRPLGLQRGLTPQQPREPASPQEPQRPAPGTREQAGGDQPSELAAVTGVTRQAAPRRSSSRAGQGGPTQPSGTERAVTSSLLSRLAAAEDASTRLIRRRLTAAVHPDAGLTAPSEDEGRQASHHRSEAIDAAWTASEAAPPPSPAELDRARHFYSDTSPAQQALFDSQPKDSTYTQGTSQDDQPTPQPSGETSPPAAGMPRQNLGIAAGPSSVGPARGGDRVPQPAALPQAATTSVPLTANDVFLGVSRLPAFVIGDLLTAIDNGRPLESVGRQLAPYSGERAADEPDAGARESVTAVPVGLHIEITAQASRRTGLITWHKVEELLRPGTTPARRQIVTRAWQVRIGFMAANASFRAFGEGRMASAAEDELRAHADAAVNAIFGAMRPASRTRAPQLMDEAATIERIAELAAALPTQPSRPRIPAGEVTTGDLIGHPGYKFRPFRVSAPPRQSDADVEITGRLTEPSGAEPAGQITLTLPWTRREGPVVSVIPVPARSLRPLFPGLEAEEGADQPVPAAQTDHRDHAPAQSAGSAPDAVPAPDADMRASQPDAPEAHGGDEPTPLSARSATPPESLDSAEPKAAPQAATTALTLVPTETGDDTPRNRTATQPEDEASLTDELEHVLDAISGRRHAAEPADDGDFADIRAAFAAMRDALGLPTASPVADGSRSAEPAPGSNCFFPAASPLRDGGRVPVPDDFTDIRAAFADLRDILGLPAGGQHVCGDGRPARSDGVALDQAAAEAQACTRWYGDTPEWQRISMVCRHLRDLVMTIREAAGDYWAEVRLDFRVNGFARTLAARAALTVSGAAHALAGRLERAGRGDGRAWRAARRLHQATAVFASQVMRYTPSDSTHRMREARRIIDNLGQHQNRTERSEAGRHVAHRGTGETRSLNAAALASDSFPVMVSRTNAGQATAGPATRTAGPSHHHQYMAQRH